VKNCVFDGEAKAAEFLTFIRVREYVLYDRRIYRACLAIIVNEIRRLAPKRTRENSLLWGQGPPVLRLTFCCEEQSGYRKYNERKAADNVKNHIGQKNKPAIPLLSIPVQPRIFWR